MQKKTILSASLMLVAAMSLTATAQEPAGRQGDGKSEPALSPEQWYYQQQLERYDDPKTAVRRNAEFQAQQRMARLEAMRWYGFSKARPLASPTPFTSMYSPTWQSGVHRPFAWYASGHPTIIVTGHGGGR